MFSIVIAIISIALVAVLSLATMYYGGKTFVKSAATATATKLNIQAQQLQAAAEMFKADTGAYPLLMEELVSGRYLKSIPVAQVPATSPYSLISLPMAAGAVWKMVTPGYPVFSVRIVDIGACEAINQKAYGISGILKTARLNYTTQCFGTDVNNLQMVTTKSAEALTQAAISPFVVIPIAPVLANAIPSVNSDDATEAGWLTVEWVRIVAPGGPATPPDTETVPAPDTWDFWVNPAFIDFGLVTTGQTRTQTATISNRGSAALTLPDISGASVGYTIGHNCPASLAANSTCDITVAFLPTVAQAHPGSVSIAFAGLAAKQLTLGGNGVVPLRTGVLDLSCPASAERGASFTCTLLITATGEAELELSALGLSGLQGGLTTGLNSTVLSCTTPGGSASSILPGESCELSLSYTPLGAAAATVTAAVASTTTTTAVAPVSALVQIGSPTLSLVMGSPPATQVGTTSVVSHILTNTGLGTTSVTGATLLPSGAVVDRSACTTLAPGKSCVVTTTCAPTAVGTVTRTLSVTGSLGTSATGTVACTGVTGISSIAYDFEITAQAGGYSRSGNWLRVTNAGAGPVTLGTFVPATGWEFSTVGTGSTMCVTNRVLAAGANCLIKESLLGTQAPGQTVTGAQRINVSSGAALTWNASPIELRGLGLTVATPFPVMQVGNTQSAVYTVTNLAPVPSTAISFAVTGTALTVASNNCPAALASGASCQVTLSYTAGATALSFAGTLSATTGFDALVSNVLNPNTAMARVQGSTPVSFAVVGANVTLTAGTNAPISVGQSVTLTHVLANNGSAPVTVTSAPTLSSTQLSIIAGGTCATGTAVAVGQSCTVLTRFSPTTATQTAASLSVATSAGVRSASVTGAVTGLTDVSVSLSGTASTMMNDAGAYTLTVANGAMGPARVRVAFATVNVNGSNAYLNRFNGNLCGAYTLSAGGTATLQTDPTVPAFGGVTCTPALSSRQIELLMPANSTYTASLAASAGTLPGQVTLSAVATVTGVDDSNAANNQASVATAIVGQPSLRLVMGSPPVTQVGSTTLASHTLTNTGLGPVSITSAALTTIGSVADRSACTTLAPAQSCIVTTTCSPGAVSTTAHTLNVAGNLNTSATGTVSCTGVTGASSIAYDSAITAQAGGYSRSGNWLRVTNQGVGPLTLGTFAPAIGWALTGVAGDPAQCVSNKVLAAGANCLIKESLLGTQAPGQTVTGAQRINVSSGAALTWNASPIELRGLGLTVATPFPAMQVGNTQSAVYTVTNLAPVPSTAISFAVTGTALTVASNNCPATLAAGATCQVTLSYTAGATALSFAGTLSATTGFDALVSNVRQATTAVAGVQGYTPISFSVAAANVTLTAGTNAPISVGQSTVLTHVLANNGLSPVTLTGAPSLYSTQMSIIAGGTCVTGNAVGAGQSCTVLTRFSPTTASQAATTLSVTTSAGVRSASVLGAAIPLTDVNVQLTGPATGVTGSTGTYGLTVSNGAMGPARVRVTLATTNSGGSNAYMSRFNGSICGTFTLTAGGTASLESAASATTAGGPTCVATMGSKQVVLLIPAYQTYTASFVATAGTSAGNVVVSAAAVVSEVDDSNAANNQASVSTALTLPNADLAISASASPALASYSGTSVLSVTAQNLSTGTTAAATSGTVTLTTSSLTGGATVTATSVSCGAVSAGATCNANGNVYLPPGGYVAFSAGLNVGPSIGTMRVAVAVAASSGATQDTNTANNSAVVDMTSAAIPTLKRCMFTGSRVGANLGATGPQALKNGWGSGSPWEISAANNAGGWLYYELFDGWVSRSASYQTGGTLYTGLWLDPKIAKFKGSGQAAMTSRSTMGAYYIGGITVIAEELVSGKWREHYVNYRNFTFKPADLIGGALQMQTNGTIQAVNAQQSWGAVVQNYRSTGTDSTGKQYRQVWLENSLGPNCAASGTTLATYP